MFRPGIVAGWRAYLLGLALFTLSTPIAAADWSLKFGASEALTLNDNINLSAVNPDAAAATSTSLNFDLLAKASTYQIEFTPALTLSENLFTAIPQDLQYLPSATLAFRKFGKRTNYDLVASFARTGATSNDLLKGIVSTHEGDQLTYTLAANLTHKINPRDSLDWTNAATKVDFTIPSDLLVPYADFTSTGTWRHQISPLINAGLSLGVESYSPKSVLQSSVMLVRSRANLDARLTKRLSVNGSIGIVLSAPAQSAPTLGPIFNVGAAYKFKTTSVSLTAGLDLSPQHDGKLQNQFSSMLSMSHQVNDLLSAGFSAGYSAQALADQPHSSVLTIRPSLQYRLARDWTSELSYQFIQSLDAETSARSNAVTLSVSYGTVVIP